MTSRPGLLDTSVLIARKAGRELDLDVLPDRTAISVIKVAELQAGVLASSDTVTRSQRQATLDSISMLHALHATEDAVLRKARVRSAEQGTSVNPVLRDELTRYAATLRTGRAADTFLALARTRAVISEGKRDGWSRDELHLARSARR